MPNYLFMKNILNSIYISRIEGLKPNNFINLNSRAS